MNDWVVESPSFEEQLMNNRIVYLNQKGINEVVELIKNKDKEIERLKKALSDINDILNSDVDVNPFCEWQVNEIADIVEHYTLGVDKE